MSLSEKTIYGELKVLIKKLHIAIGDHERLESIISALSKYAMQSDLESEKHGHAEHIAPVLRDEALKTLNASYEALTLIEECLEKVVLR